MPKVTNTRKQRATELLETIRKGPCDVDDAVVSVAGERESMRPGYDLWFKTWIERELIDLIPELRKLNQPSSSEAAATVLDSK